MAALFRFLFFKSVLGRFRATVILVGFSLFSVEKSIPECALDERAECSAVTRARFHGFLGQSRIGFDEGQEGGEPKHTPSSSRS